MGDYFGHWIGLGRDLQGRGSTLPKIFTVNWFRTDENGKFVWPGFGENMRVLQWIIDRVDGRAGGDEHVFGITPRYDDLQWSGLPFPRERYQQITAIDAGDWRKELTLHAELFSKLRPNLPEELEQTRASYEQRLSA
jgi:phosphoenolpyruvate carboxykinase (GTP)